VATVTSLCKHC